MTAAQLRFRGRLDNRQELAAAASLPQASTDSELILHAYRLWGENCPQHLLGDFAFILYDPARRAYLCARDPLGIVPLYYAESPAFLAAFELAEVLANRGCPSDLNEGMAAEYLVCDLTSTHETLWTGIYRLEAGHSLTVVDGAARARRYFEFNPDREIRYAHDSDYTEHFLELIRASVQCRLRTPGRAGVLLSGGVDSSSVTAVAAPLQPGLEAFSLTFPGLPCDESSYMEEVGRHTGVPVNYLSPAIEALPAYTEDARQTGDFPGYPNGSMCRGIRRLAAAKGFDVLLTGLGGDEWFMGSYYHYADLLRQLRFGQLTRELRGRQLAAEGRGSRWRKLARWGIWPLLPAGFQRLANPLLRAGGLPDWIHPDFARRTSLADRLRAKPRPIHFRSLAQRDIYDVYASPWRLHALEMEFRAAAEDGVEQRHPFSDLRIVEFALALPESQRWRGSQTKFVVREAMRGLLPERVRLRTTKAEFSPVFMDTFSAAGGDDLWLTQLFDSGWIDRDLVRRDYRRMQALYSEGSSAYTRQACPLWMVLGIHVWRQTALARHTPQAGTKSGLTLPLSL